MSQFDQNQKSAEGMVRDTVNRGQAATEKTAQAAQESYSAMAHDLREFNVKVIDLARANTEAFFEFAREAALAKEPAELMKLWPKHARKQLETFGKQSQELTSLGHRLASEGVEPVARSFGQVSKAS